MLENNGPTVTLELEIKEDVDHAGHLEPLVQLKLDFVLLQMLALMSIYQLRILSLVEIMELKVVKEDGPKMHLPILKRQELSQSHVTHIHLEMQEKYQIVSEGNV